MRDVAAGFRVSAGHFGTFLPIHLAVRLAATAVIVPVSGLVLAVALAASGQSAVTDQDIARFLLTPAGAAGALALAGLGVVAAVLDVAVMSHVLRRGPRGARRGAWSVAGPAIGRFAALFWFGVRLTLRVLWIAAPFAAAGAAVAWLALGRHDVNYYLTHRPPAFLAAAGIGALLAAGLAARLAVRLSGWAVALHLVLFEGAPPRRAFDESARRLAGRRRGVVVRVALWAAARVALAAVVAGLAGPAISAAQRALGADLRAAALVTVALLLIWALANAAVSALSNGALAALLDRLHRETGGGAADRGPRRPSVGPGAARRAARLGPGLAAGAVALTAGGLALGGAVLERVSAEREVEIIAHRGAAAVRPENTLAAVEKALEDRADWVEIDVQETADGQVVVAHDSDFMKLAGAPLKVWQATAADLAGIDVGSWFDPAYADQRTPTLHEVLETARGRGKVLIELKYYGHDVALEARVAEIVEAAGMGGDVAVMSLKIPGVRKMRALRPDWPHGILAATALGDVARLDADFLAVNAGQVSTRLVRRVHAQGRRLHVWTVDDPVAMVRLISMGVDGLITNEPALARQVMEARNRLSAPERLLLWLSGRFRLDSFDLTEDEVDA